jgi:hypothetical protein
MKSFTNRSKTDAKIKDQTHTGQSGPQPFSYAWERKGGASGTSGGAGC